MNNETDLDWLARNVHVWDESAYAALCGGVERVLWISGAAYGQRSEFKNAVTKDQWLSRRAELQSKPSWKEAPEWANYLAIDGDSVWYWHEMDPKTVAGCEYWMSRGQSDIACRGELLGDWCDTLEKRPEEFQQFTSIEDNQEKDMKQDSGWFERGELPPVGALCEALSEPDMDWLEVEVIAHRDGFALVWCSDERCGANCDDPKHFRPIRTERDVLIEIIKKTDDTDDKIADAILAAGFSLGDK